MFARNSFAAHFAVCHCRGDVTPMARLSYALEDFTLGARFLWRLPPFLRHPVSPEQALAILRRRLAQREADFLALMRQAVYGRTGQSSPYRELLGLAGCEYGDLERLVGQEGLEHALHGLYRQGVYLSVDEYKGRRPAVRGSATIPVGPARLRNPCSGFHLTAQTGGSRGAGTLVSIDLAFIRDHAVDESLNLEARGGLGWRHAFWGPAGGVAMYHMLYISAFGRPDRLFSRSDPPTGDQPRYRWSARMLNWGSRLAGVPLPTPEYAPLDEPRPIVDWMTRALRAGGTPHLYTYASAAGRLCEAAVAAGADLRGARLTVGGEPVTASRLDAIRQTGARPEPRYGSVDSGAVGRGCLAPHQPDDLHLLHDLHALIQPGRGGERDGLPADAVLLSSLRRTDPLVLLNVSLGDQAEVVQRSCGCPLERLGWTTHLHTVRSFEKLTAGGMTFLDTDVIRVLEEVLPARFGGSPTDYQLVEEEADDGQPRLRLLVHPALGRLDAGAVSDVFLSAIGRGSGAERIMGLLWRDAGFLRVERQAPLTTSAGKILHLHRKHAADGAPSEPVPGRRFSGQPR
jgi:hypothetical protein